VQRAVPVMEAARAAQPEGGGDCPASHRDRCRSRQGSPSRGASTRRRPRAAERERRRQVKCWMLRLPWRTGLATALVPGPKVQASVPEPPGGAPIANLRTRRSRQTCGPAVGARRRRGVAVVEIDRGPAERTVGTFTHTVACCVVASQASTQKGVSRCRCCRSRAGRGHRSAPA